MTRLSHARMRTVSADPANFIPGPTGLTPGSMAPKRPMASTMLPVGYLANCSRRSLGARSILVLTRNPIPAINASSLPPPLASPHQGERNRELDDPVVDRLPAGKALQVG